MIAAPARRPSRRPLLEARAPLLVRPVKGAQLPGGVAPELVIFNPEEGQSSELTATFTIYSDVELQTSVLSVSGVALQSGTQTGWTATMVLPAGNYYWRARFTQGTSISSPWSEVGQFSIVAGADAV